MERQKKYNNRNYPLCSYVLLPAVPARFYVRFILRMELNANPLASEFDPFGRNPYTGLLGGAFAFWQNLWARFAKHFINIFGAMMSRGACWQSTVAAFVRQSLHQKVMQSISAKLLFRFGFGSITNYAPDTKDECRNPYIVSQSITKPFSPSVSFLLALFFFFSCVRCKEANLRGFSFYLVEFTPTEYFRKVSHTQHLLINHLFKLGR